MALEDATEDSRLGALDFAGALANPSPQRADVAEFGFFDFDADDPERWQAQDFAMQLGIARQIERRDQLARRPQRGLMSGDALLQPLRIGFQAVPDLFAGVIAAADAGDLIDPQADAVQAEDTAQLLNLGRWRSSDIRSSGRCGTDRTVRSIRTGAESLV